METAVRIFVAIVRLLITALQLFMLARAVLSWLPFDEESPLQKFVFTVTEPVIIPIRAVLEKSEKIASLPIDLSFIVAYFVLIILSSLLPSVRF